jgi:hypothetical protein
MSKHLERLAERVGNDPFFLAAAISAYQRSSQIDDQALAAKLGCPTELLARVRLCRMPASAAPEFWRDIKLIAERFSVDPDELAEVVRHGESVVRLRAAHDTKDESAGFLMAARDDELDDRPPPASGEKK